MDRGRAVIRVEKWMLVVAVATLLCLVQVACSGGDEQTTSGGDTTAATEPTTSGDDKATGEDEGESEAEKAEGDETAAEEPEKSLGPARTKRIDELLRVHPIFTTKRFMNFAAHGDPGACALLSDKGRRALEHAHNKPCPQVIRSAAAQRGEEPGLIIAGEFVPADEFSDLDFHTTIFVLKKEFGRVTIRGEARPFRLTRYGAGNVWLLDAVPLAQVGTVR